MFKAKKENKNQLSLFEFTKSLSPVNTIKEQNNTDSIIEDTRVESVEDKEGFIYVFLDKGRDEIKMGFTSDVERRRKELQRGNIPLKTLAHMSAPTIKMEKFFHKWLHKMGINSVGSGVAEWYSTKEKGYEILRYLPQLPVIYLKKAKLTEEERANIQRLIDKDYFDVVFPDEKIRKPVEAKYIAKPSSYEEYIQNKNFKGQMIKEAEDKLAALSPAAINQAMKAELERLKEERLRGSYSYDEVANEFGIYPRSFREYVSGRRKPGKGVAATRYGFALEKYYLDKDVNRWFIRDDYAGYESL